jgi:hypothetical protein
MLNPDGTITIHSHLPASTIMQHPEWLKMQVEYYFNSHTFRELFEDTPNTPAITTTRKTSAPKLKRTDLLKAMPTPEGLARTVGFSNFTTMRKAIENPDYPEASRHYLLVGCSIIADILTRAGLFERLNTTFAKFVMSAYLGINEKTEAYQQVDNKINITWCTPTNPLAHVDTIIEMERLETCLPEGMRLPAPTHSPLNVMPTSQLVEVHACHPL